MSTFYRFAQITCCSKKKKGQNKFLKSPGVIQMFFFDEFRVKRDEFSYRDGTRSLIIDSLLLFMSPKIEMVH